MSFFNLQNNNILITGAGSGIGQETAITLSKLGCNLALLDISEESLSQTLNLLEGQHKAYEVDLTKFDVLPDIVKEIISSQGPIGGFVHCAGISSRKPLNTLKPEGFAKVMNVNFFAFEEFVRLLAKRGNFSDGGSIVVMSSISSIRGYKAKAEYCVSKAAVDAFVRCMALELAPRRIRVNSVMPAEVLTPLAFQARKLNAGVGASDFAAPLGPTEPYEVANTIAFLLSDCTKTITGSSIVIDGGATI